MKRVRPSIDFLHVDPEERPEPSVGASAEESPKEMIRFEEPGPKPWSRKRIQGMRDRAARVQRQHRALLAYTAALGFIQVVVGRLLIMGVGHKNMKTVDPLLIPLKWRGPHWELGLFAYNDHPFIVYSLFMLLLASMAVAVTAWGMSTSPKVDSIRRGSPNLRHRRAERRFEEP